DLREDLRELREVRGQAVLLLLHRAGVVDDEEEVEVAVQLERDVLDLDLVLAGLDRGDSAVGTSGEERCRQETDAERTEGSGSERTTHGGRPPVDAGTLEQGASQPEGSR